MLTTTDWAGLTVSFITIISAFIVGVRFLVKHYLSELKPDGNGGHNFEGRVTRIEKRIDAIYALLLDKHQ